MSGWICLHRKLLEWEWYEDVNVCRLFIHCLLRANHKPKKWQGIEIGRGQFWTSLESLSKETGLSARNLRTAISKLESTGELTSKGQARGRMITVVQYDSYQESDKPNDKLPTSCRQATDKLPTTNNNDNNENNETSKPKTLVPAVAGTPSAQSKTCGDVIDVFEHWKQVMGKNEASKLTKKRKANVTARIKEGYTVEQIKQAIEGCAVTPHNMGQNNQGKRFDDLELICRSGENVERFANNLYQQQSPMTGLSRITQQNIKNLEGGW